MSVHNRVPAGVSSAGGQFAAPVHPEVDVSLAPTPTEPSTDPNTAPFGRACTLEALQDHYEALTSPENISWDGERSGAAMRAEYKRLQKAYWVRRDEIDPRRERAWCIACRVEVPGVDGDPGPHQNDLGRECWVGKR